MALCDCLELGMLEAGVVFRAILEEQFVFIFIGLSDFVSHSVAPVNEVMDRDVTVGQIKQISKDI